MRGDVAVHEKGCDRAVQGRVKEDEDRLKGLSSEDGTGEKNPNSLCAQDYDIYYARSDCLYVYLLSQS